MSTSPPLTDPRFDAGYNEPDQTKPKRSAWATCLIGCLVTLVILFVLGAIAVYWVSQNWRAWTADITAQGVKQIIATTSLPEQEKLDINMQVDRLATAMHAGRLSMEQWGRVMQDLAESPLMTSFMVSAIDQGYFAKSGLSDEEKAAGKIALQRFLRGILDEEINEQGIDAAMMHVATRDSSGEWQIRQQVTDPELRAFLETANDEADKAGVPVEPPEYDPSDEFKRIVDDALGAPGGDAADQPDAPAPGDLPPDASAPDASTKSAE